MPPSFPPRDLKFITVLLAILFLFAPLFPQLSTPQFAYFFRSVIDLLIVVAFCRLGLVSAMARILLFPISIPALAGLAWLFLELMQTPDLYRAKGKCMVLLTVWMLFVLMRLIPITNASRRWLCLCLALGGVLAALHGLYLQWTGFGEFIDVMKENALYDDAMRKELIVSLEANRALGRFGNPNHLAGYLALSLWPFWFLWKEERAAWPRRLLPVMALPILICLYRTYSRSGLLALLAAMLFVFLYELIERGYGPRLMRWAWIAGGLCLAGIVAAGLLGWFMAQGIIPSPPPSLFGGRLLTISTVEARMDFYRGALAIIKQNPWLGVGPEGFESYYCSFIRPGDRESRYVHNFLLEAGVEGGAIGFFLVSWLLFAVIRYLRRAWQNYPHERAVIFSAAGCFGTLVFLSLLDFHNNLMEFWIAPVFFLGLASRNSIAAPPPERSLRWMGIGFCAVLALSWTFWGFCRYFNEIDRDKGYYLVVDHQPAAAQQAYERAVLFDRTDADSWRSLSLIWAEIPERDAQLRRLSYIKTAVRWAPRRALIRSDYAAALFALGYSEQALREIEIAQRLFPARPKYYEIMADFYRLLGQPEQAAQEKQKAEAIQKEIEARYPS
ncbi:MAG: O-antigen ligase family protein [Candidatus Omnitrophota bacterium]